MIPVSFLLFALASSASSQDPLDAALESYQKVTSYRVSMRSRSGDSSEIVRYFFKKPGFVRMEFIEPHKGAVLVYNPEKKTAKLRPFGFLKLLVLSLGPGNPLITSSKGHRVDASDIGALLETAKKLRGKGKSEKLRTEAVEGKKTVVVAIGGEGAVTVAGNIHRCLLWLDTNTFLPVRTATYDGKGALIEDVILDDMEVNIRFPDTLFEL